MKYLAVITRLYSKTTLTFFKEVPNCLLKWLYLLNIFGEQIFSMVFPNYLCDRISQNCYGVELIAQAMEL